MPPPYRERVIMGEFPNKATQFSSTNQPPPERKTHGLQLSRLIKRVWNEEIKDDHGNETVRGLLAVKALMDKAEEGDVQAFRELADRVEGKSISRTENENTNTNTNKVTIIERPDQSKT